MPVGAPQLRAEVTQLEGYELKPTLGTGTVASIDNRNRKRLPHAA